MEYKKIYPQTNNPNNHDNEIYSKNNLNWNLSGGDHTTFWIGGQYDAPNLSKGFHGILKQYWDYYTKLYFNSEKINVLLVSENINVKKQLEDLYPNWDIDIIDLYPELQSDDGNIIIGDICLLNNPIPENKYNLIISQAILEHVYNPFQAMVNFSKGLKQNGLLVIHTHPPGFGYHRYPSDYIRFMKDWWYDIEKYIDELELLELYQKNNNHVFSCYRKI
jgi:hypothetical protein